MANTFLANCKNGTKSSEPQSLENLSAFLNLPCPFDFGHTHGGEEWVVGNLRQEAGAIAFLWDRRVLKGVFKPILMDHI